MALYKAHQNKIHQLSNLGLEQLSIDYRETLSEMKDDLNQSYDEMIQRRIDDDYENREDSYEGDREEYYQRHPKKAVSEAAKRTVKNELVAAFIAKHPVYPQMMRQIVAYIGENWKVSEEPMTSREFLDLNCSKHFDTAIWMLCTSAPRGTLVDAQYKTPNSRFCALVPLILSAFKEYQNIEYTFWEDNDLDLLVDAPLAAAMRYKETHPMDRDDIMQAVDIGLTIKTGPKAGTKRPALTSYALTGLASTCFNGMPPLASVMYGQVWCAHPANRNEYMILDPKNWDAMPPPLVGSTTTAKMFTKKKEHESDVPW